MSGNVIKNIPYQECTVGSTSLSPDSGSHLGLKKIQYITEGQTRKRPKNMKRLRPDLNLVRQEYH